MRKYGDSLLNSYGSLIFPCGLTELSKLSPYFRALAFVLFLGSAQALVEASTPADGTPAALAERPGTGRLVLVDEQGTRLRLVVFWKPLNAVCRGK